jgi:tRNA (mo5U34)-methyltransferase
MGLRELSAPLPPGFRVLSSAEIAALATDSCFVRSFRPRHSAEQTLARVAAVDDWYHTTYLGHGLLTPGPRDTFALLHRLQLPPSLAGKSVLDVGSGDGFFSFECEARGAVRVVALDTASFRSSGPAIGILRELFASRVELVDGDISEPATMAGLHADVVLFLGVLYHLQDPFLALRRLRQVVGETLYLETHVVQPDLSRLVPFGDDEPPIMMFYEADELAGDPSNWWGPNLSCLIGMLRAAGFERPEVLSHTRREAWHGRAVIRASTASAEENNR